MRQLDRTQGKEKKPTNIEFVERPMSLHNVDGWLHRTANEKNAFALIWGKDGALLGSIAISDNT